MVGGVTVNIVLGLFIYILVVSAWGENRLENDSLNYGLAINKELRDLNLGIEDGDKIIAVDGEPIENVNALNIQVFLRGYRTLDVQKPNGNVSQVVLDEDFDDFMWENGAVMAFTPRLHTVVDTVIPNTHAEKGGLMEGDSIVSVNNVNTPFFHLFQEQLAEKTEDSTKFELGIYRDNELISISLFGVWNNKSNNYTFGFGNNVPSWLEMTHVDYTFGESISRGFTKAGWTMYDYAGQLPLIFTSKGISSVGGFGAIGNLFPPTWDWHVFWANTAFISLILAIMNILPIPALDGGHIVFLLYEMITGKEAPQKVLEYAQLVGFVVILSLFVYANGNDVYRAFFE
jgi:regulator of sigma E protease